MTTSGGALDFLVLGPVEVLRGGLPVLLPSGQRRALLGLLLVHAGEVVPVDRIVDELWRGDPPASAEHALQVYVSGLRKVLEPGLLRRDGRGYVLRVPPEGYDRARFETRVTEGRQALGAGRTTEAARLLDEAESMWRGRAFADLADEPFIGPEAARLDELRLVATEGRVEAQLALGRHVELAGELETLVGRHPFREHLWSQLMVALYRSGRQADALRAYQRLRTVLADELGLEPSPKLRSLETAILCQDPELADSPQPDVAGVPTPVPATAPGPTTARSSPGPTRAVAFVDDETELAEMRVVTAVFVDLVGSTGLAEMLEPDEYALVVGGAVERMTAGAEALGGTVASRMGDGILALFGARAAHEDDPERAVRAALAIVDEVDRYGAEVARSWEVDPLRARAGIDAGPVMVPSTADEQVLGDALNTAARLQDASRPGGVLCSMAVGRLVGPLFDWGEPQKLTLKGKQDEVEAVEAVAPRAVPGRVRGLEGRDLPLIGREAELAAAARSLDSVVAGAGGILIVSGEPGTGKSRVLAELRQRFAELGPVGLRSQWLEGRCLSWGESSAYGPFRELLREWLGVSPTHPALRTRVALRRRLDGLFGEDGADVAVFLTSLLGLPPEGESSGRLSALPPDSLRHGTFEAVRSLLGRLADDGPVVLAVDDLHWADDTSLQLIEHLFPATETHAVLMVLALRPEPAHRSWQVRETVLRSWAHRSKELALDPLAPGAAAMMLGELLAGATLPAPVAADLLDAAEGNPLYIEELVRSLLDAGSLRERPEGWQFDPTVTVEIPRTVENVLAARIDRLPAASRAVLGVAAILGRQFDLDVLNEICDPGTDVNGALAELLHLGLVEQARRWPTPEYRFRHVLGQEAAYRRLVPDRRRDLHRRAARALVRMFPDAAAEQHAILALHHEGAGEPEPALAQHRLAGDAARRAHALDEAARHYSSGLALTAAVSPAIAERERPALHLWRGHVWYQLAHSDAGDELRAALAGARAVGDTSLELRASEELAIFEGLVEGRRPEGVARLEEALAVAVRAGDQPAEVALRNRLTVELVNRLDLDQALVSAERALTVARTAGDEMLAARAMDGLKLVAFVLGDFARLRELAVELEAIFDRQEDQWYLTFALAETSFGWAATGDWEEAARRLTAANRLNRDLGDRANAAYLLTLQASLAAVRGHYGEALDLARTAAAGARDGRNTQWIAWSEVNLGVLLAELGEVDEAVERLEAGRAAAERGVRIQLVRAQAHLAAARSRVGSSEAESALAAAEGLLDEIRTPPGASFLYGLDAYLAVAAVRQAHGDAPAAERLIAPLLAAAESAGWAEGVGRAALALGECAAARGNHDEASRLLSRAATLAADVGIPGVEWGAEAALAVLAQARGDWTAGHLHGQKAQAIIDRLAASITDPQLRQTFTVAAGQRLRRLTDS